MAKKNLFGFKCHCCGADITAPQFHNGLMYGYTCITKVAPRQRKNKLADLLIIPFESIKDNINNFIPSNQTRISRTQRIGYTLTVNEDLKLFINLGDIYRTVEGLNPRAGTEYVMDCKIHIDHDKKVVVMNRDYWSPETLSKLKNIPTVVGA